MAKTCWIVGAGVFTPRDLKPAAGDLLIAADGGYRALMALGMQPDLLLGDFDSLDAALPSNLPILRYPEEKDDTDMGLAVREGWERGYRAFALYGGGGGRVDHLVANIQLLCRYSRLGGAMRMIGADCDVYAVTNGTLHLPPRERGTLVSVFCNGDTAHGVTLNGLKYPLHQATLTCDYALGVSNQYLGEMPASVSVESGTLFVMVYPSPQNH